MGRFEEWKPPKIEHNIPTKWNWVVAYPEGLILGKNTDIGAFTYIMAKYGVVIEDEVQIGGGCKIYLVDTIDNIEGKIIIKKNACIGANSVILPNVIIEENSFVGSLSLIKSYTHIKKNEIWVGIPAKKIIERTIDI